MIIEILTYAGIALALTAIFELGNYIYNYYHVKKVLDDINNQEEHYND